MKIKFTESKSITWFIIIRKKLNFRYILSNVHKSNVFKSENKDFIFSAS